MRFHLGAARCLALSVVLGAIALPAPCARAEEKPKSSPEGVRKAKKHFEAAKKAYTAGQYNEAVDHLNQAIASDPNGKDLFYNLGLVEEKLGNIDDAIAAFKRYTELETDTAELEKSIQTLRRLEGARDELKRKKAAEEAQREKDLEPAPPIEKEDEPAPIVVVEKSKKGRFDGWVIGAGVVAAAAAGAGAYFGVRAMNTRKSANDPTGPGTSVYELQDRAARAHDYAVTSDIFFGVAIAAVGTAAVLYFTRDAEPSHSPKVGLGVSSRGASLSLMGAL